MTTRTMLIGLAGIPTATLLGAYLWLAHEHGTPWVLGEIVHEGGRYTLAETILYWRHFLRELPVAVLYAAAAAAGAAVYGPQCAAAPSRAVRAAALGAAALLVGVACAETARVWPGDVAWREALQSYLHDEDAPSAGVHWGYHLLSTCTYLCAAVVLATLLQRLLDGGFAAPRVPSRARWLGGVLAVMIGITVLCGLGPDPFVDSRYLGHQAREAATHLFLTLPLSFAVLLAIGRWTPRSFPPGTGNRPGRDLAIAIGVGSFGLGYLAIGAVFTRAVDAARPGAGLSSLLAAHVYEHSLDYLLVALLVTAFAPAAR